jgi:predicted DNA-binding WGR domain protein
MVSRQTGQKLTPEEPFSFGLKIKIAGSKKKTDRNKVRLEHTTDGHNKFYEIEYLGIHDAIRSPINTNYKIKITYGKIHTQGSVSQHGFNNEEAARHFMEKKIQEKLKKGYKR